MYSPKKVISPRKPPLSPKGAGIKRSLPPKTLANYFKISSKCKSNDGAATSQEKKQGRYLVLFGGGKATLYYSIRGDVWRRAWSTLSSSKGHCLHLRYTYLPRK